MTIKYPAIPNPSTDPNSLRNTALALKETAEILTQQRGSVLDAVVTWQDLLSLGLINSSQLPKKIGNQ